MTTTNTNTAPRIKARTYSLALTLLYLAHSPPMFRMICKKLESLVQDLLEGVYFSTENVSFMNPIHVSRSRRNKLKLVNEHLRTCKKCRKWGESLNSKRKLGSGGISGTTSTRCQSLASPHHKRPAGIHRSRTKSSSSQSSLRSQKVSTK